MRTRTIGVGVLAAGILLAGCSSGETDAGKAKAATTPSPATTVAPTTTPPPTTQAPMALGQAWDWSGTQPDDSGQDVTVSGATTATAYQQPAKTDAPSPKNAFGDGSEGYVWADIDVKVCSKDGTFTASTLPWQLLYPDGARLTPSDTTYDGFPQPEFPAGDVTLTTGRCVRGKIVFSVPGKSRPISVVYAPDVAGDSVEWTIPAK